MTSDRRANNIARLQNSSITRPDQRLAVLQSYTDNVPIPNFPQTPAGISGLSSKLFHKLQSYKLLMSAKWPIDANLGLILRHLELSVAGDRQEKEGRLRVAIGLLEKAV